jgi:hypothetical protein
VSEVGMKMDPALQAVLKQLQELKMEISISQELKKDISTGQVELKKDIKTSEDKLAASQELKK